MNVTVSNLQLEISPELNRYAQKKTGKFTQIISQITDIKVRLLSEKNRRSKNMNYYCEITVHIPGKVLEIVKVQRDMTKAIDKAIVQMQNALRRHSKKTISNKHQDGITAKLLRRFKGD